ncbi:MAG TPA: hypothetical protein VEK08_26415 [Planctomycetota bacterium]|nr:hypothetical protein [Planctomycetota bacterium]
MSPSVFALALAIIAWASYVPVAKSPALRRTMWPTLALMALAAAITLVIIASRQSPGRANAYDYSTLGVTLLFLIVYVFVMRVPKSEKRLQPGARMPLIELPAENGAAFSTAAYQGKGPLLLVFFRGFW